MISLADDLRESTDSLDLVLKRHNHNLRTAMGEKPAPRMEYTKDEIAQMSPLEKYDLFKRLYLKRLDLEVNEILDMLSIQSSLYMHYLNRIKSETGLRRYYNQGTKKVVLIHAKK